MKPGTENIYQRKINQVTDYINANLHLPLRLGIITGQVNVSERQLLHIMKGALNESLYAYVARQRVKRAALHMHTEDMSLADLVNRVGYDSPQSFSKALKKQSSVSSKAYMDKLRARLKEETEKWSNASVGKEIIPSGMFGMIRLQKGKHVVYTLKGSYAGLQELYNIVNIDFNHTKRHGMVFEEHMGYPEEDDDTQVTKIYISIKQISMETKFYQSCGMPLQKNEELGTNHDGSKNEEYCCYCYKGKAFTMAYTMDQMVDHCAQFADEFNRDAGFHHTREEAAANMELFFPILKRWAVR